MLLFFGFLRCGSVCFCGFVLVSDCGLGFVVLGLACVCMLFCVFVNVGWRAR